MRSSSSLPVKRLRRRSSRRKPLPGLVVGLMVVIAIVISLSYILLGTRILATNNQEQPQLEKREPQTVQRDLEKQQVNGSQEPPQDVMQQRVEEEQQVDGDGHDGDDEWHDDDDNEEKDDDGGDGEGDNDGEGVDDGGDDENEDDDEEEDWKDDDDYPKDQGNAAQVEEQRNLKAVDDTENTQSSPNGAHKDSIPSQVDPIEVHITHENLQKAISQKSGIDVKIPGKVYETVDGKEQAESITVHLDTQQLLMALADHSPEEMKERARQF